MHGLFIKLFGYKAPVGSSAGLAVVVALLIVFALTLPKPGGEGTGGRFWVILPVTLAAVYFGLLRGWKPMRVRTDMDRLAVASGLLGADLILGYTGTVDNKVDHWGQVGLIVVVGILLVILYRKLAHEGAVIKT
jgi:hypothetical protein